MPDPDVTATAPDPAAPATPPSAPAPDAAAGVADPPSAASAAGEMFDGIGMVSQPENAEVIRQKGWKNPDAVVGSYRELERKIGSQGIKPPAADASPEEWAEFHAALPGVPEDPAKYAFPGIEGREQSDFDKHFQGHMGKALKDAAVSQRQLDVLYPAFQGAIDELNEQAAGGARDAKVVLDREWGADRDTNLAVATRMAKFMFGEHYEAARGMRLADGTNLLDHPIILRAMHHGGEAFSEDAVPSQAAQAAFGESPETASRELEQMKADPAVRKILGDPGHADYRATTDRWNRLNTLVARSKAAKSGASAQGHF